jgi:hypothetical protein
VKERSWRGSDGNYCCLDGKQEENLFRSVRYFTFAVPPQT